MQKKTSLKRLTRYNITWYNNTIKGKSQNVQKNEGISLCIRVQRKFQNIKK